jgi:hypothetical protein
MPHLIAQNAVQRIRAVAAELDAAGLTTRLQETRGVVDLTASVSRPGGRAIEVIVDQDGYVELRYWTVPGATPTQIAATITRALAAVAPLAQ